MTRKVIVEMLLLVILVTSKVVAQQPQISNPPVLRPTVKLLGEVPESGRDFFTGNLALSPNEQLIVYTTNNDVRVWNVATHEQSILLAGEVHTLLWGPKGDAIVFQTHPNSHLRFNDQPLTEDAALWTIAIDSVTGKALGPPTLAAKVPVNHGPFLSPDEQMIAFVQWWGAYVTSVAVVPRTGGAPRILASGIEMGVDGWDPTGTAVYYTAYDDVTAARHRYRVSLKGGEPVVVDEVRSNDPAWGLQDPDTGKTIARMEFPPDIGVTDWGAKNLAPRLGRQRLAGVREVHPRGLRLVSIADASSRELVDMAVEVGIPTWFADGSRLAVIVRKNGESSLLTQRADGGDARMLPFSHRPAFGGALNDQAQLRISPNGRYAAFKGENRETIELMDLSSGRQRTLVNVEGKPLSNGSGRVGWPDGNGIGALAWSDDSKSVFYVCGIWTSEPAVHEVTLSGADKVLRTFPLFVYAQAPMTFPSPTQPQFIEIVGPRNPQGGGALTLVPLGGGPPRVLFNEPAMGGPLSPDRRTLAVQKRQNGQPGVLISLVSIDGSSAHNLPLPFIALPGVTWHPDGQRLLMLGRERPDGPVNVYSVPINGAAPAAIATVGLTTEAGALAVSPDGQLVAVTVAAAPTVAFVELDFDVADVLRQRK